MKNIFIIHALTPGEVVPMHGHGSLTRALERVKELNLSSYRISKGLEDGSWEDVLRHPVDAPEPTAEQYKNWLSYPVQECNYTKGKE